MDLIYHIKALLSRLFMLSLSGLHRSRLYMSIRLCVSAGIKNPHSRDCEEISVQRKPPSGITQRRNCVVHAVHCRIRESNP